MGRRVRLSGSLYVERSHHSRTLNRLFSWNRLIGRHHTRSGAVKSKMPRNSLRETISDIRGRDLKETWFSHDYPRVERLSVEGVYVEVKTII